MDVLVFDTGPLAHFARAGWLGVLKSLVGSRRALIPAQVAMELQQAAGHEHAMGAVLDAAWIEHYELHTEEELIAFAGFAAHLMSEGRNQGETAVLAVAETMPAQACAAMVCTGTRCAPWWTLGRLWSLRGTRL